MKRIISILLIIFFSFQNIGYSQSPKLSIKNDVKEKVVVFGNSNLKITLDYQQKCNISCLEVNGEKVIEGASGVYSQIRAFNKIYSTLHLDASPTVEIANETVKVKGIKYGDNEVKISENWIFTITGKEIIFNIERTFPKSFIADEVSSPSFNFKSINTWEGAFLESGGLAWFYLFREKQFTYGVHSNYSAFWNSKTSNGLKINVASPGKQIASSFTRSDEDKLVYNVTVSNSEMTPRYDEDTHRRRFIRGKSDVWSSIEVAKETVSQTITLTPFNYQQAYNRS